MNLKKLFGKQKLKGFKTPTAVGYAKPEFWKNLRKPAVRKNVLGGRKIEAV